MNQKEAAMVASQFVRTRYGREGVHWNEPRMRFRVGSLAANPKRASLKHEVSAEDRAVRE